MTTYPSPVRKVVSNSPQAELKYLKTGGLDCQVICSVDPEARIGWRYPGAQTDAPLPGKFTLCLVCPYRRRLRNPMVQSFVMIVTSSPGRQLHSRDLSTAIHTPVRLLRAWARRCS